MGMAETKIYPWLSTYGTYADGVSCSENNTLHSSCAMRDDVRLYFHRTFFNANMCRNSLDEST